MARYQPLPFLSNFPSDDGDQQQYQGSGNRNYLPKFVFPLLKRHECPLCFLAMKNPVQTECGHVFCRECLEPVLKERPPVCPLDRCSKNISQDSVFPDNARRREILHLDVYCSFKALGCMWIGPLERLEVHIEHDCLQLFRPCPNRCGCPVMKLPQLQQHLEECPEAEITCPFKANGCSFASLRKIMPAHLELCSVFHWQIQVEEIQALSRSSGYISYHNAAGSVPTTPTPGTTNSVTTTPGTTGSVPTTLP